MNAMIFHLAGMPSWVAINAHHVQSMSSSSTRLCFPPWHRKGSVVPAPCKCDIMSHGTLSPLVPMGACMLPRCCAAVDSAGQAAAASVSVLSVLFISPPGLFLRWRPRSTRRVGRAWERVPGAAAEVGRHAGRGTVAATMRQNVAMAPHILGRACATGMAGDGATNCRIHVAGVSCNTCAPQPEEGTPCPSKPRTGR